MSILIMNYDWYWFVFVNTECLKIFVHGWTEARFKSYFYLMVGCCELDSLRKFNFLTDMPKVFSIHAEKIYNDMIQQNK